ncbi:MAG TPA: iron ABC transporter permease [Chloroflexota bacterium]|nr:iron ABC transporter permease [Chloroflexota bacterium]
MATISLAAGELIPRRLRRLELGVLACTLFLGVLALVVLYPLVLVLIDSFEVATPRGATYGLGNWQAAFTEPGLTTALVNTVKVAVVVQAISLPLAIVLAWVIARTDMPGADHVEFLFWVSFFLPTLVNTAGWILLADPNYGVLNQLLMKLPFFAKGPLNIYSFWGIVFVHLTGLGFAAKIMLLVPSFRNVDATLEEASRMAGVGPLGTLVRIVIPAVTPAILVVFLASLIRSFEAFEVELVLGTPIQFSVYSTKIYGLINQSPVNYGGATALSMIILLAALPLVLLQLWVTRRRSYTTVTGHAKATRVALRRWRWPVAAAAFLLALLCTVIPVSFMMMGSLMGLFGYFGTRETWTLRHWLTVLAEPRFLGALTNTLILGVGTAVVGVLLYSLMAYVAVRTRYGARWAFDVLTWVPFTIPGIILGLAYLLFVLQTPALRPFYGSTALLVLVSTLSVMTVTMQLLKSSMLQLSFDLEEASRTLGGSWWYTFRRVVVPLVMPAVMVAGIMAFATAARQVAVIVPLTTSQTEPLAVLQLGYLMAENRSAASVVGTVIVVLTISAAALVRWLGGRAGVRT